MCAPPTYDDGVEEYEPPFDQPRGRRWTRPRAALAAGAALLLAAVVTGFALRSDEEPVAAPPTIQSTTSTTTTIAELPAGTYEIATVKDSVSTLKVWSTEPEEWAGAKPALVADMGDPAPASQAAAPPREPLPAVGEPIVGRVAVPDGWEFANPGPYDPPQPFTMLVTERRGQWAKVMLPVRPNGTEGWVDVADVELSTTQYRIEVKLAERMLRAYDGNELIAETPVVVGSPFTQTPTGRFYVTDVVPQDSPAYGPVALATNGYSEVLDEFSNGVPVVALHGTNRPEQVGEAISNGCVRIPNEVVQMLADTVPPGTPVDIWP